ncbi:hypothetical protein GCM10009555_048210 [Acrocarpospora macrocephala]|uniref:Uncharacterized protein n=1 Tax=Acrocarpospora macrocephala TaxID=150177 RepID=A0A5M3XBY5_9ACTN|nr:hypothetical protein [Acrocarpospora macrocephala]GES17011.1 hypothetical protein Amac_106090 [Acrocarpospora macrocephala]
MEPYDTATSADCFVAAKKTFDGLIGQLADPASATLTHGRVEEMLHEQGRELLRQLLQAYRTSRLPPEASPRWARPPPCAWSRR